MAAPQTAWCTLGTGSFALLHSWEMLRSQQIPAVGLQDPWLGPGASWLTHVVSLAAGRTTTSEELEDMLESGNPAIFSSGVSIGTG